MSTGRPEPGTRPGCLIFCLCAALLAAGIVVAVKVWPQSAKDRQSSAIEACENRVDDQYPSRVEKKWRTADAIGPDQDHYEVTGRFFSPDVGSATFSCSVIRGKVTAAFVSPG